MISYNKVDVLLTNNLKGFDSPGYYPSMGLELLKEQLINNGISCEIDYGDQGVTTSPLVFGVGGFSDDYFLIKDKCKSVKECNPNIKTIVGGSVSLFHDALLADESIDAVFFGESEASLLEYAMRIKNNEPTNDIPGVYQRGDKSFVRRSALNLDELVTPSYQGFNLNGLATISTTRGCNGNCSFCKSKLFSPQLKYMSANKVIEWVNNIRAHNDLHTVQFMDDNFLANPVRAERILKYLKANNLNTIILSRADGINNNQSLIRDYASIISNIMIGVESFSQSQLNRWRKRTTIDENNTALGVLYDYHVPSESFMIMSDGATTIKELEEQVYGSIDAPMTFLGGVKVPFIFRNTTFGTVGHPLLNGELTDYIEITGISHLFKPQLFLDDTDFFFDLLTKNNCHELTDLYVNSLSGLAKHRLNIFLDGAQKLYSGVKSSFSEDSLDFIKFTNSVLRKMFVDN